MRVMIPNVEYEAVYQPRWGGMSRSCRDVGSSLTEKGQKGHDKRGDCKAIDIIQFILQVARYIH
jgi:hypothetical protein